jgi:phosphohistidine phosphatase
VLLLRHGKSDWAAGARGDHERPLTARGVKAARRMGRFLAMAQQIPDRVLCSSAVRAQETLRLAIEAGGWSCPVEISAGLYAASPGDVLALLRQAPDEVERLLLVGHEPTWSDVASALIGGGVFCFPTAAIARIDLPIDDWSQEGDGQGELIWFVTPRLLRDYSNPS